MAADEQPNFDAAVRPSSRNTLSLSPATIRSAEAYADQGKLRAAAQIVEKLLADDTVRGSLDARTSALTGADPIISGTAEAEFREDFARILPDAEFRQIHQWGLLLGACPTQNIYRAPATPSDRWVPEVQFWPPHDMTWSWDTSRWSLKILDKDQQVDFGDLHWGMFAPYGTYRPWMSGLWRTLVWWVLLKQYALHDWGMHSENAASLVASTANEGMVFEARQALAKEIYDRGKNGVIVLPPGCTLSLLEATANTRDIYAAQIDAANTAIAVAVRGGNLTTNVSSGSHAAAAVQARVETGIIRADEKAIAGWLHASVVKAWLRFNQKPGATVTVSRRIGNDSDRMARAATLTQWATALTMLDGLGLELPLEQINDELGIALRKKGS